MIAAKVYTQPATINSEYSPTDTVDFGMSFARIPITTYFNVKNLSPSETFSIGPYDKSFFLGLKDNHVGEFQEFENKTTVPFAVGPSDVQKFYVNFKSDSNLIINPPRKNTAKLRLGLYNSRLIPQPITDKDLVAYRDFVLIGRKTIHYIDVFETKLDFDSVYVNPKDTMRKNLIIQNSSKFQLSIDSLRFDRPFTAQIKHDFFQIPSVLNPYLEDGFQKITKITFYPINQGADKATISFGYKPDKVNYPDSVDIRSTEIVGVGVEQQLNIIECDTAPYTHNTIDFGDVDVGKTKRVKFIVRLFGNLPFGYIKDEIIDIDSDKPADGYKVIRKLNNSVHLQPFLTDTVIVEFQPTRSDTFNVRYQLTTDLKSRKVWGYQDSIFKRSFIFKGIGKQAEIASLPDTIDFGNIIINEGGECPTRRDSVLTLSNIGNLMLKVVEIKIRPDDSNNPFKVERDNMEIPGKESRHLRVFFDSIANQLKDYEAYLYLTTNSPKPKDSLKILLRARGVFPDTMDIKLPQNLKAMPGRRLNIPILIDKNKISLAKIYIDTISYNNTILNFYKEQILGTASELAEKITVKQDSASSSLFLNIRTRGAERFLLSDTLIILQFDTYLGDNIETPLHFVNPKFGDGKCSRILSTNRIDGSFSIDSVCGLEYKIGTSGRDRFKLMMPTPNPTSDILTLNFEMAFKTKASIMMYNSFGEIVKVIVNNELPSGSYETHANTFDLPPGIYFVKMNAGIFSDTRNIIITR